MNSNNQSIIISPALQSSVWCKNTVVVCVFVQETVGAPPGWRIPPPGESKPAVPQATPSAPRGCSAIGSSSRIRLPIGRGAPSRFRPRPGAATRPRPLSRPSQPCAAIEWGRSGGRSERGGAAEGFPLKGWWRARRAETERRGWTTLGGAKTGLSDTHLSTYFWPTTAVGDLTK